MLDALLEVAEELEKNSGADTENREVPDRERGSGKRDIRIRVVTQYEEILKDMEQPGGDEVFQPVSGNTCGLGRRQEERTENRWQISCAREKKEAFWRAFTAPKVSMVFPIR